MGRKLQEEHFYCAIRIFFTIFLYNNSQKTPISNLYKYNYINGKLPPPHDKSAFGLTFLKNFSLILNLFSHKNSQFNKFGSKTVKNLFLVQDIFACDCKEISNRLGTDYSLHITDVLQITGLSGPATGNKSARSEE